MLTNKYSKPKILLYSVIFLALLYIVSEQILFVFQRTEIKKFINDYFDDIQALNDYSSFSCGSPQNTDIADKKFRELEALFNNYYADNSSNNSVKQHSIDVLKNDLKDILSGASAIYKYDLDEIDINLKIAKLEFVSQNINN
ncbi:MAG: hypothetical protein VB118_06075 [Oscillospiraceae bacterium]|nr:hypothetical protein [Oscillospiraceae bacterium]